MDVIEDTERVRVEIHWAGGHQNLWETIRPVARLEQLSYYPDLCQRIRQLTQQHLDAGQIAKQLNHEGWRPPKRSVQFKQQGIAALIRRLGLRSPRAQDRHRPVLDEHQWWLQDLARELGMPDVTLYNWMHRGWVQGHRQAEESNRWILWADEAEVERLRQWRAEPTGRKAHLRWVEKATGKAATSG